ncbi:MAG: hypothetical protein JW940_22520 [Polyangiaceae bacterium]|nr:hypothetical protein [Polyangiaceae bacterium]
MKLRATSVAVAMSSLLAAFGCKKNDAESEHCPVGMEDCPCTRGGACDRGLKCIEGVCEDVSASAGGAGGASSDTSPTAFAESAFGELPDCTSGCGNSYERSPFDVKLDGLDDDTTLTVNGVRYSAVAGIIDGEDHSQGFGYDLDFIRVDVAARRLVEITVTAPKGSDLDPYVSTYDPVLAERSPLYGWMTQNDLGPAKGTARTVIAAPTGKDDPWYVVVDDAHNALGDGAAVGGEDYRYEVSFRVLGEVSFKELRLESDPPHATLKNQELRHAGDIHYFTFVDPEHRSFRVDFETSNDDFCGHVWQIDLLEGAGWIPRGATDDSPEDGCEPTLGFETRAEFYEEGTDAYALAVTDYLGRGSDTEDSAFDYTLRVEAITE